MPALLILAGILLLYLLITGKAASVVKSVTG